MYLRPRIPWNRKKLVSYSVILALGMIAAAFFPSEESESKRSQWAIRQLQAENDSLKEVNRYLVIRNDVLERRSAELDTLDRQLEDLHGRGYLPKKLYLRFLQRRSREMNIDNQFILNVLKTESSFWSQLDGPFGEVGGFQILPETLRRYVCEVFEVPESDFRLEDYTHLTTNTEWAYVLMIDMKFKKHRLVWSDWNGGWR